MLLSERNDILGSFRGVINTINKAVSFLIIYGLFILTLKAYVYSEFHIKHVIRIPLLCHKTHFLCCSLSLSLHHVKYFARPTLVSPSWNHAGLPVDKDHRVAFPLALFLLDVVVQVLVVTSHSLSEGVSHFQSVLQIIYQTVCQPHCCETIAPSNDSL